MSKYTKLAPALLSPVNKSKNNMRAEPTSNAHANASLFILKATKEERNSVIMDGGLQEKFRKICVLCGSNSGNRTVFSDAALDLGNELGSGAKYKGLVSCAQTIVREEGPAALLKGIGPRVVLWIGIGG